MKIKNIIIIAFLFLLISMVIVKSFTTGHFRTNAQKWSAGSFDHSNLISQIKDLAGNTLLVQLNEVDAGSDSIIHIPPEEILNKENFNKLKSFDGNIVLISGDPAISARIWMLLSQLGIKDLYILENV